MHCKLAISAALVGLLAQISTATTCTPQNATPLEPYISSGGGGGGSGGGGVVISQDPFAWVSNAVKKRTTPDARLANIANALAARDLNLVECTATESCVSLSNIPFCLNMANGDFHDGLGSTGNALTGDYVLADGRKGNLYTGPYPQVTVGSANAATTAGSASGSAQTGSAGTGSAGAGSSGSGSTGAGSAGAGKTGSGAVASTPTATGAGAAASPTKNAAVNGKAGRVAVGGAMALLGAVLL